METLKHLTGLCGEVHLNIYHIIILVILFKIFLYIYKTLA